MHSDLPPNKTCAESRAIDTVTAKHTTLVSYNNKENQNVVLPTTVDDSNKVKRCDLKMLSVTDNVRADCEVRVVRRTEEKKGVRGRYGHKDFEVGCQLGYGKYGRVYRAKDTLQHRTVALKLINLETEKKVSVRKQIQREIEIQGNIKHPNIVQLFGFFVHDVFSPLISQNPEACLQGVLHLILEFAEKGSLFDMLQREGAMNEGSVAKCLRALAMAVGHLHRHGIIHRDIKPENILLDKNGDPKLADFGWSILAGRERRNTMCGTLDYIAPEMIAGKGYNNSVDLWSLGVLAYELLFGIPPFFADTFASTSESILRMDFTFPSAPVISRDAKDFIQSVLPFFIPWRKILVREPEKRMGIDALLRHRFISKSVQRDCD